MKKLITTRLQALILAIVCTNTVQASSLKVYNMYERPIRGITYPEANCGNGSYDCVVFPYASIFHTNSVTFTLPDQGIEEFFWKGIIGPRYKATVNLQKNEHATLEILGEGYYKFKGKKKYAKQI